MTTANEQKISRAVQNAARTLQDPANREVSVIDETEADTLAAQFGRTLRQVHIAALKQNIWPSRYLRNHALLGCEDQIKLAESKVTVVGAGGLGGTVIALLARIGIGFLTIIDSDVFEETNLNRQLVSNIDNLGKAKSIEACKMAARINPAVETNCHTRRIDSRNATGLLTGTDVLVDALDNIPDRFVLEETASQLGIPMVHGALAGFDGQVMTVFPGDPGLKLLYGEHESAAEDPNRAEAVLGVPALTPSAVATIQAAEVVKIILGRGQLLRNRMLHIDLESGQHDVLRF